jgi:hypothetical protein
MYGIIPNRIPKMEVNQSFILIGPLHMGIPRAPDEDAIFVGKIRFLKDKADSFCSEYGKFVGFNSSAQALISMPDDLVFCLKRISINMCV